MGILKLGVIKTAEQLEHATIVNSARNIRRKNN